MSLVDEDVRRRSQLPDGEYVPMQVEVRLVDKRGRVLARKLATAWAPRLLVFPVERAGGYDHAELWLNRRKAGGAVQITVEDPALDVGDTVEVTMHHWTFL